MKKEKIKTNPYSPSRPANESTFVGRIPIKNQLVNGLKQGKSFAIYGSPGIGKASLLLAVKNELSSQADQGIIPFPFYVKCHQTMDTTEKILLHITDELIKTFHECKMNCPQEIKTKLNKLAKAKNLETSLNLILKWAYDQRKRSHLPILLLDRLHHINKEVIYDMATIFQTLVNKQQISLILSSETELSGEYRDDTSPLRHLIDDVIQIEELTREETELLVQKASEHNWPIEKGVINYLYEITKGDPYRIHYYLNAVLLKDNRISKKGLKQKDTEYTRNYLDRLQKRNHIPTENQNQSSSKKPATENLQEPNPTQNQQKNRPIQKIVYCVVCSLIAFFMIAAAVADLGGENFKDWFNQQTLKKSIDLFFQGTNTLIHSLDYFFHSIIVDSYTVIMIAMLICFFVIRYFLKK
ncbi:membrane protein containing ATPase domain protein, prokaryote domain protein [Candidatus Magnetomorum sp. HK-1]|nr:membrane protein containing ATPase domain protein, prokaryote domain protein [Candidatus Magnetomorum sp. HK-1]